MKKSRKMISKQWEVSLLSHLNLQILNFVTILESKRKTERDTIFYQHAIEFVHNPSWGFIDTDIGKLDTF